MNTEWQQRLPMRLTLLRIFLAVPACFALSMSGFWWNLSAAVLFIVASITDYYDGYFARKYNATTNMGKFMDPIADKILVTSILTLLIVQNKIDPFLVIILTARDTYIGGIRAVAAADGVVIAAKTAGKWKTALQMTAIPATIIGHLPFLPGPVGLLGQIGYSLLWISTILSMTSGVQYELAYREACRRGA